MEENPETVLIAVDTNFDTNLVVIAPRSATVADVLEKIKQGHMALYPSDGSINILAVKVEMFNRHYLIEESLKVGQIFRGWQGCLHVEVTGYRPNSPTASKLRLPLISAGDKAHVSPCKFCKHPLPGGEEQVVRPGNSSDRGPTPSLVQPEISLCGRRVLETTPNRAVASQAVEVIGSQKSSDGRNNSERLFVGGSQDFVLHRQARAEGQGIETVEAGLDMALDAILDAGPDKPGNLDRHRDRSADSNGRFAANEDISGGTLAFAQPTPGKSGRSKAQFSGDSRLSGERKRRPGDVHLTGPQSFLADPAASLDIQERCGGSAPKKNRIRGKSGANPLQIDQSPAKTNHGIGEKILDDGKVDGAAAIYISSGESAPDNVDGENAEGISGKRAKAELRSGAETSEVRVKDSITQGKTAVKAVVDAGQVGKTYPTLRFGDVRSHSSGSSTTESSEKSEVKELVKVKAPERDPVAKRSELINDSSDESSSGDSSKSYRPDGNAGAKDVDEVVKDLVNLYSPIISDESGREQSSDASEELRPKGLRRSMNSHAVDEAENTVRSSRRGSRTTAGLYRFQHFIDSQDGLDQLLDLTLSQRKTKPSSEIEPAPQAPDVQRGALAFDSFSVDVVPDTQVGNANIDASADREVYTGEIIHGEKTTGEALKDAVVKLVQDGDPDIRPIEKDKRKTSKTKSKRASLSADANDDPSESLKNFASIASESARKLDSNEDFLQPKSDDSQQFQAAVQLTRLSMDDGEEHADSDPMPSPKSTSVEKKKKKKKAKVKPDTSVAVSRENDLPDNVGNSAGTDPPKGGLATAPSDLTDDSPSLPPENPLQEVGVDKTGADVTSPGIMLGVRAQTVKHGLNKIDAEVSAVIEAVPPGGTKLDEENVELQMERGRLAEAAPVVEDSEGQDRDRSDFAAPSKAIEKKKPGVRRRRELSVREKETELNIIEGLGGRREEEPTVPARKSEDVPYEEDSPMKSGRAGGEGQDEPSSFGGGRSHEKSGRKIKAKKGTPPANSPVNEERGDSPSRSLLGENREGIDRGSDKKQSVLRRVEADQAGTDDGFGAEKETGAVITPGKRKKKKPKADSESRSFGIDFANADEARGEVMQIKSSSKFSADGGLTPEAPTSSPIAENFSLTEGRFQPLADKGNPVKLPVSRKKKAKRASSLEPIVGVTDAEEIRQKELNQATSDVGAIIPVSELGHGKPPRPRKKVSKHLEHSSTSVEKANLVIAEEVEPVQSQHPGRYIVETISKELKRRMLSYDLDSTDFDSKDGILNTKPAVDEPSKKVTSPGDDPSVESLKKRRKKKTFGVIEGDIPLGLLNMNGSPSREDRLGMGEDKMYGSAFDNTREGGKTATPRKKKKTSGILSIAEGENDEALEPSCNQLGYRGSGLSELNTDVIRDASVVGDVFMDDRSTEGHTKAKKKRAKSVMSDVEKTVRASSPIPQQPGSWTPKPKKRKQLTNSEHNGATSLRGANGRFVRSETVASEDAAPCPYPGCERVLAEGKPSWFRHIKFCEYRPDDLPVPKPNKLDRKKRRKVPLTSS